MPALIQQITPTFPVLIACIGLGLILFAVGDEARIFSTGLSLVGASSIALSIFFVWNSVSTERDKRLRGILTVARPPTTQAAAAQRDLRELRPTEAKIIHRTGALSGRVSNLADGRYLFDFVMSHEGYNDFRDAECPEIFVAFESGDRKFAKFKSGSPLASYGLIFHIIYQVDSNDLAFRRDGITTRLPPCDEKHLLSRQIAKSETNISDPPVVSVAPETNDARKSPPPVVQSAPLESRSGPSQPSVQPAPVNSVGQVVGYVVFGRISATGASTRPWFSIEGKSDARVPVPGDVLTVIRPVMLRKAPYHWNDREQRHVPGAEGPVLTVGRRAVVGGDAIIANDEQIGVQYVIVPIATIVDQALPPVEPFRPNSADPSILGYVYAGSVDETSGELSEEIFENLTKPGLTYPRPNDVLVAKKNVWLRAGPRRWDALKNEYVNEKPIKSVREGQYVRVSGDVQLARGGLSIWVGVDQISATLQQVASK